MFAHRAPWTNRIALIVVAVTAGIVLADRFDITPRTGETALLLYHWALLLGAFTLLLGVGSAIAVHLERILRGDREWLLSLLLVVAFVLVLVAGLTTPGGVTNPLMEWTFDAIIAPGQATLFALTGFFVVAAAYQYLRLNRTGGLWMLAGALITLFAQTPLSQNALPPVLVQFADWLLVGPVMAAMRGALLGGAIATLFVGIRFFVGQKS